MSKPAIDSFTRTFANRDLFAGSARWAIAWSLLSGLFLAVVLVCSSLLASLLIERGSLRVSLTSDEAARFEAITTLPATQPSATQLVPNAGVDGQAPAQSVDRVLQQVDDEGLIGPVWHSRDTWCGPTLGWLYRRFFALRQNSTALILLIVLIAVSWLLRQACLRRIHRSCQTTTDRVAVIFRKNLHRQALRLSPEDIDESSAQSALSLFTTQVESVRSELACWIETLARYSVEIVFLTVIAWSIDYRLAIQWLIPLLLCWLLLERSKSRVAHARLLTDDRQRNELQALSEQLLNARLVRGFGMEQAEHDEFLAHSSREKISARSNDQPTGKSVYRR